MDQREAWLLCIIMCIAFLIVLAVAGAVSSMYGPEGTGIFYILLGSARELRRSCTGSRKVGKANPGFCLERWSEPNDAKKI